MKLVILDRDGVINEDSPEFVKSVAEWRPIPGSLEAIARLTQSGYKVDIKVDTKDGITILLFGQQVHQTIRPHSHIADALFEFGQQ